LFLLSLWSYHIIQVFWSGCLTLRLIFSVMVLYIWIEQKKKKKTVFLCVLSYCCSAQRKSLRKKKKKRSGPMTSMSGRIGSIILFKQQQMWVQVLARRDKIECNWQMMNCLSHLTSHEGNPYIHP
jgi:hypothetical protein